MKTLATLKLYNVSFEVETRNIIHYLSVRVKSYNHRNAIRHAQRRVMVELGYPVSRLDKVSWDVLAHRISINASPSI